MAITDDQFTALCGFAEMKGAADGKNLENPASDAAVIAHVFSEAERLDMRTEDEFEDREDILTAYNDGWNRTIGARR